MTQRTEQTPKRPKIRDFEDYRDFLDEMFLYRKAMNPRFSYQMCARALDTTQSYLKLVTTRRRHISLEKLLPLCELFKLSPTEERSLIFMALAALTKDERLSTYFKNLFLGHARTISPTGDALHAKADPRGFVAFQSVLHAVVLQLMTFPDFEGSPEWIWKKMGGPPLRLEDVTAVFEHLVESGMIRKSEDGKWIEEETSGVTTADPSLDKPYRNVQESLLHMHQAFEDVERHAPIGFRTLCMAVTDNEFQFIRTEISKVIQSFIDRGMAVTHPTDVVYINYVYANMTPRERKKKS